MYRIPDLIEEILQLIVLERRRDVILLFTLMLLVANLAKTKMMPKT